MKKQIVSAVVVLGATLAMTGFCLYDKPQKTQGEETTLSVSAAGITMVGEGVEPTEIVYKIGYITTECDIKEDCREDSNVIGALKFNSEISWTECVLDNNWIMIQTESGIGYIKKEYLTLQKCDCRIIDIPNYSGFKSWEDYRCITLTSSPQYKLQQNAYTNDLGIREVDDRYCIAVGNGTRCKVGDYVDLVLENGNIIPCIIGDIKDNSDTDSSNLITTHSDCCSEFIIATYSLDFSAKADGDMSSISHDWDSRVVQIRCYNKNYFTKITD